MGRVPVGVRVPLPEIRCKHPLIKDTFAGSGVGTVTWAIEAPNGEAELNPETGIKGLKPGKAIVRATLLPAGTTQPLVTTLEYSIEPLVPTEIQLKPFEY